MPTKTTGLRELTERVLAASPGDSLGLRYDLETQLALVETIVEEFSRSLDPALHEQWGLLVESIEQDFDLHEQSPEIRARVNTHRLMLDTTRRLLALRLEDAGEITAEGR